MRRFGEKKKSHDLSYHDLMSLVHHAGIFGTVTLLRDAYPDKIFENAMVRAYSEMTKRHETTKKKVGKRKKQRMPIAGTLVI